MQGALLADVVVVQLATRSNLFALKNNGDSDLGDLQMEPTAKKSRCWKSGMPSFSRILAFTSSAVQDAFQFVTLKVTPVIILMLNALLVRSMYPD